ncbi:hypothetical protein FVE85_2263 [Porphyridium purpureum]|uniref:F-box domain-containing protein n=1 Tax=Porphyridium purpureum TaxID=35688 RepID=A0A5J4YYA2_PORPP|nr:hypothetical protein FVE85_2263 [Porphyridium purpureum]|eukprot:POR5957..scf209_3
MEEPPVARLKRVLSPRAPGCASAAGATASAVHACEVDELASRHAGVVHASSGATDAVKGSHMHALSESLTCLANTAAAAAAATRDDLFASDAPPSASPASAWKRRAMLPHARPALSLASAQNSEAQPPLPLSGSCAPPSEPSARRIASFRRQIPAVPVIDPLFVPFGQPTPPRDETQQVGSPAESEGAWMMDTDMLARCALTPAVATSSHLPDNALLSDQIDAAVPQSASGTSIECLPEDALINVLRHLPHIRDVLRARSVCRPWRDLIDSNAVIFSESSFRGVKFHRRVKLVLEPSLRLPKQVRNGTRGALSIQNARQRDRHQNARIILEEPAGKHVVQCARRGGNLVAALLYSVFFERYRVSVVTLSLNAALSLLEPQQQRCAAGSPMTASRATSPKGLRRLHCAWLVPHPQWVALHVSRSAWAQQGTERQTTDRNSVTDSFISDFETSSPHDARGSILGLVLVTSCVDRFTSSDGRTERRPHVPDREANGSLLRTRNDDSHTQPSVENHVGGSHPVDSVSADLSTTSARFEWRVGAALRFDKALICAGHRGLRKLNNEMSEMIVQMPSELEWFA